MKWILTSIAWVMGLTLMVGATLDFYNMYLLQIQMNTERRQTINFVSKLSSQAQDLVGNATLELEPAYIVNNTYMYFRKLNTEYGSNRSNVSATVSGNRCTVNVLSVPKRGADIATITYDATYAPVSATSGIMTVTATYNMNILSGRVAGFANLGREITIPFVNTYSVNIDSWSP